jgi:NAD kinase
VPNHVEPKKILVVRRTRLEELVQKYHTLAQAKFYIEHLGADFAEYVAENEAYISAKRRILETLAMSGRYQILDRAYLPNFVFGAEDIVMALGQDGLVANTMKYLTGQPLIGVNPDVYRYDGVLLPFEPKDIGAVLKDVALNRREVKSITMARASLSDGQTMFAVNDLFIGPKSHTSARYEIRSQGSVETQSSSGIIVSTGLGSTGWMKSVVTGSLAIAGSIGVGASKTSIEPSRWDTDRLKFAVREPFPSKTSQAGIVYGEISAKAPLELHSRMPENGVIFSDGIEADHLDFNSGAVAKIEIAERIGRLVV